MKTRLLIIVIVTLILVSIVFGLYITHLIKNMQDQEAHETWFEQRPLIMNSNGLHNLNSTEREEFISKYTDMLNGEFHDHAYIIDLQSEYAVDESITFTVATWGFGHPCQSPSFIYYYETKNSTNIVFEDKFIRYCQPLKESEYGNYYSELNSSRTTKALNDNIFPVFDKPGNYIVSVDDKANYEFEIADDFILKTSTNCRTLEQNKETAPFFKTPTYLPAGYFHVCSQSGTPSESYIVYHHQEITDWNIPKLISDGAIFIYQIDERNILGAEKLETLGTAEQRIQETYDSVIESNHSLQPQLIRVNGMLAYAVDSCPDCGMQTANFADGTFIQKSTSTETKIKFIDENGINYMLKTVLPLDDLILVAESLQ